MDRRYFLKLCILSSASVGVAGTLPVFAATEADDSHFVKDYLTKIKNFDRHFADDIKLSVGEYKLLGRIVKRLGRLQSTIGYANFSLVSFDQALRYARNYSRIGAFTDTEIKFLELVFYTNAKDYGFFGEKVSTRITEVVKRRDTLKIPRTGHYLIRGEPYRLYKKIRKDVGRNITLTSGVRGVVKQIHLFLAKALRNGGNLSLASRSLAPPGHSFHGVGDFDVGKYGYGRRNFTLDFAETSEFKKLRDIGYIKIRYHEDNPFGVRFEPWHIKVA